MCHPKTVDSACQLYLQQIRNETIQNETILWKMNFFFQNEMSSSENVNGISYLVWVTLIWRFIKFLFKIYCIFIFFNLQSLMASTKYTFIDKHGTQAVSASIRTSSIFMMVCDGPFSRINLQILVIRIWRSRMDALLIRSKNDLFHCSLNAQNKI